MTLKRLRDNGEEDRILAAQDAIIAACDGMTRSAARTTLKRIVNQFNSAAESMGLPPLRPLKKTEEWALDGAGVPPPVLFYAGIRAPAPPVVAEAALVVDDPAICDAYVENPVTRARYALEPIAGDDMLMLRVAPPALLPFNAFRTTLVHFVRTHMGAAAVVEPLAISVDWEPFRRNVLCRIVFPRVVQEHLLFVLRTFFKLVPHHDNVVRASNEPLPLLPTLCRRARVRLVRVVEAAAGPAETWRFEDVSEY